MTDEYELLPADELAKLRREVEQLKMNPLGGTPENKTLLQSIDQLNVSINKLIKVYGDIKQDMMDEYQKVKSVDEQFDDLKDQNKKIATGVLTVAKMLQDHHETVHTDRLETPAFTYEQPLTQQVPDVQPQYPQNDSLPSGGLNTPSPAFSTLPEETAQAPLDQQQSQDSFSQAMAANQPRAPPIDPWQPQTAPLPSWQQQGQESMQPPPPPFAPAPDGLGMPPPPPAPKKRGLFS